MKKTLFLLSLLMLFSLPSCVKESPEPIYTPETVSPENRKLLYSREVGGITFGFYNDNTAELFEVSAPDTRTTLTIPEKIENHTLVAIGEEAFLEAPYVAITLPDTIEKIGVRAFQKSRIKEITLPDALTELGKEAFDNCLRLTKITFGSGLKEIPLGCFFGCSALTGISVPEGVETIGEEAFASLSALEELSLPSTLKEIGAFAFWHTGAASLDITVPSSVNSIGEEAFAGEFRHNFRYLGESTEVKSALGINE